MSEQKPEVPANPGQQRITIELPKDLEPVYANLAFISHTPAEVVIDFAQVLPRTTKGKIVSRIIISPMHVKLLYRALGQNISNFEKQFGEIKVPQQPSLADQLFRFPQQSGEDEQKGE